MNKIKKFSYIFLIICMLILSTITAFYTIGKPLEQILTKQSNMSKDISIQNHTSIDKSIQLNANKDISTIAENFQSNPSKDFLIISEDFEESWPPTGWNITLINGTGVGTKGNWTQEFNGTYDVYPYQGDYMAMFNSHTSCYEEMARLETPQLDLESYEKVEIGFWMYHDSYSEYWVDILIVQVSLNNGEWINISNYTRYQPNSDTWIWHQLNLSEDMLIENVRIGFLGISGFGNNIYIDDFKLRSPFNNDVGVIDLVHPSKEYIEGFSNVDIIAKVKNFGLENQSNIPVNLTISGPLSYSYEDLSYVNITLSMNEKTNITFDPAWSVPNIKGIYSINISTEHLGDEDETNDYFTKEIYVYEEHSLAENFDKWLPEGWELVDNYSSWWEQDFEFNNTNSSDWYASANRFNGSEADCWIITPRLSIQENDKFTFWYSTNNFTTENVSFEVCLSLGDSQKDVSQFTNVLLEETTSTDEWIKKSIDLQDFSDNLAFIGIHCIDLEDAMETLNIDDVYGPLILMSNIDIGVVSINQPQILDPNGTYRVNTTVKNYGETSQSFSIICEIYKLSCIDCDEGYITFELIYSDIINYDNLDSGNSASVLFAPWYVDQYGRYSINISVVLNEDENPENNFLNMTIFFDLPMIEGLDVEKTMWNPETQDWVTEADVWQNSSITNRIEIPNNFEYDLVDLQVTDLLPIEFNYTDNATVNGDEQEPRVIFNKLTWNISAIEPGSTAEIIFTCIANGCGTTYNIVNVTGYLEDNGNLTGIVADGDELTINVEDITSPISELKFIGNQKIVEDKFWISNDTIINLSATDDCSTPTIYYRVIYNNEGSWEIYSEEFSLDNYSKHIIEYYSIDENLNKEKTKTFTFYVDNSSQTSLMILGDPHYINQSDNITTTFVTRKTPIYLNATYKNESISECCCIHYKLDNGSIWAEWIVGDWYQNILTSLGKNNYMDDGYHQVCYYTEDFIGNIEIPHFETIFSDNSCPETTLNYNMSYIDIKEVTWITPNTSLLFTAVDGGSPPVGILTTYFAINDSPYTPVQTYTVEIKLPEGNHTIRFYSMDLLYNKEDVREQYIAVDGTSPETTLEFNGLVYEEEGIDLITSETEIILIADDHQQSGVNITYYRLDNGPWIEYNQPFTVPWEGTHFIEYYSFDMIGNTEEINNLSFIVNDLPPEFYIIEPLEGKLYKNGKLIGPFPSRKAIIIGKLVVTIYVENESLSMVDKVTFTIDDEINFTLNEPPFQWIMLEPPLGNHIVKITIYDKFGRFNSKEINLRILRL